MADFLCSVSPVSRVLDVSSQQGLLKLENRAFLAINQVERKSSISKSNKGS